MQYSYYICWFPQPWTIWTSIYRISKEKQVKMNSSTVKLPVYLNAARSVLLFTLDLQTKEPGSEFHKRGVALLSSPLGWKRRITPWLLLLCACMRSPIYVLITSTFHTFLVYCPAFFQRLNFSFLTYVYGSLHTANYLQNWHTSQMSHFYLLSRFIFSFRIK